MWLPSVAIKNISTVEKRYGQGKAVKRAAKLTDPLSSPPANSWCIHRDEVKMDTGRIWGHFLCEENQFQAIEVPTFGALKS